MITGTNFIGFKSVKGGGKMFTTTNPVSNTENPWKFTEVDENQVDQALGLATQAFEIYQQTTPTKRAEFLNAIADGIEALGDSLINTYCLETGLPQGRAKGERGRTVGQLRSFANLVAEGSWVKATIDTADLGREPMPKLDIRKMMVPLGPVVVFGASNFPLAYSTAGGDTASALAAGCPVVVKSHPMHAGTGELVATAIIGAAKATGMPDGVFSNLNSSGIEVGQQLVKHPQVKAVGFTGSIKGGRALLDLAAARKEPIPVFAEMGSVNPVVLLPIALGSKGDYWAKTYAGSITLGTGQFCTNPGVLLGLDSEVLDHFIQILGEEIIKIEPSCMLHPNIAKAYETNKNRITEKSGVNLVAEFPKETAQNHARQAVVKISGADFKANPEVQEEVFGPFSLVVACSNTEEMNQVIALMHGQLTGTIIAERQELDNYGSVVNTLRNKVGRLIFNGVPTGVEVCAAMQHGGPYPASTDSRFSAVGVHAIDRWVRPLSYQNWPNNLLPAELRNENPLQIVRTIDGTSTKAKI
ncbi:NADP-dependent fatty aldehyde dehydrogenase [Croceitalea dokdonensis DOKDO 023]|uniref:NADP-dependent fatty aldehyde dehydrogenase n=1 Tax=Croceitalea dokdonensis DOKDO 023 TaxID=1300341 RepID=A0A0P7AWT8_9FLAO|nr:aldehyde dehydrogenase (NADP(+)) [Croceitalea dokdonensis]KPM33206.1 NADP-dependent fatty aldehyde dehydrogenase [Croceitalea dokdonensis DOKDO 023]